LQVWTGGLQIRGELMHKACSIVPHAYGLARGLGSRHTMEEVNKWLVDNLNFLHPNINISVSACCYENRRRWHVMKTSHGRMGSLLTSLRLNGGDPKVMQQGWG